MRLKLSRQVKDYTHLYRYIYSYTFVQIRFVLGCTKGFHHFLDSLSQVFLMNAVCQMDSAAKEWTRLYASGE